MPGEDTDEILMKAKIVMVSGKAPPMLGQYHGRIDNHCFCLPSFSCHLIISR